MAERIRAGLRQGLFLAVPTALGYIALGYVIIGAIYRGGLFGIDDNWLTYFILATYSLGLLATVGSRLLQNGFWALGDTRTPARMALVRAIIALVVAIPAMFALDQLSVSQVTGTGSSTLYFGAVGLAAGSAVAAWVEWIFLGRALKRRLEAAFIPWRAVGEMILMVLISLIPTFAFLVCRHPKLESTMEWDHRHSPFCRDLSKSFKFKRSFRAKKPGSAD